MDKHNSTTHNPSLQDNSTTHNPSLQDNSTTHNPSLQDNSTTHNPSLQDNSTTHNPSLQDKAQDSRNTNTTAKHPQENSDDISEPISTCNRELENTHKKQKLIITSSESATIQTKAVSFRQPFSIPSKSFSFSTAEPAAKPVSTEPSIWDNVTFKKSSGFGVSRFKSNFSSNSSDKEPVKHDTNKTENGNITDSHSSLNSIPENLQKTSISVDNTKSSVSLVKLVGLDTKLVPASSSLKSNGLGASFNSGSTAFAQFKSLSKETTENMDSKKSNSDFNKMLKSQTSQASDSTNSIDPQISPEAKDAAYKELQDSTKPIMAVDAKYLQTFEEDESCLFAQKCKLFELVQAESKDGNTSSLPNWAERGVGLIKLNKPEQKNTSDNASKDNIPPRLVMRTDLTFRLVLNNPLFPEVKPVVDGNYLRLTLIDPFSKQPANFAIKLKTKHDSALLADQIFSLFS
ncbi:hypothetical protein BB561_002520 [Smittium simulii]|uniref:RanBD1 domain-containing protein n=1 Tax=Smittium simulii TaxID=133385 RepID=A0A2T9YQ45_9FUNG|nr:hypothetical protein BB561_002520 [Smittium simulii]